MHAINRSQRMEVMSAYLSCETARSLQLLRQIDGTIEALVMTTRQLEALTEAFCSIHKQVISGDIDALPEENVIPQLEDAQDSMRKMHDDLSISLARAKNNQHLKQDDGVVDACEMTIDAVVALNQTIEKLRWSILELNADAEGAHEPVLLSTDDDIDSFFSKL